MSENSKFPVIDEKPLVDQILEPFDTTFFDTDTILILFRSNYPNTDMIPILQGSKYPDTDTIPMLNGNGMIPCMIPKKYGF